MSGATFQMYRVTTQFLTAMTPVSILSEITVTVTDDDTTLHANEIADPGVSQVFTSPGHTITSYEFQFNTTLTYTPTGSTTPVTIPVKVAFMVVDGTSGYYLMAASGSEIVGLNPGQTVTRASARVAYTAVDYEAIACFAAGTLIDTPTGRRAIEDIHAGDEVLTLDNGPQRVRWIGSAWLGQEQLDLHPEHRPIRISAGALGNGAPNLPLRVSPQHRFLLRGALVELHLGEPEVLAPARHLLGNPGFAVERDCTDVVYFHLLFDRHEIVLANGAPAESFLVGDQIREALPATQIAEITRLFPKLAAEPPTPARRLARRYEVAALHAVFSESRSLTA